MAVQGDDAVLVGLALGAGLDHDDVAADLAVGLDRLGQGRDTRAHEHVRQHHREGLLADDIPGAPDRVTEPQGRHLAHEAHLPRLAEFGQQVLEDVVLALGLELGLELHVVIEIVLDRLLAPAGDEDEVLDAGGAAFGDDIGQDRPVDDVQHLLGGVLGPRQHAGAQARNGKDGFTDRLHLTSLDGSAPLEEANGSG